MIDVDRSVPADPARDLAEFIHRLRSTILRDAGAMKQADLLTSAFLDEYAAHKPSLT